MRNSRAREREVRVGACADYLLGVPIKIIMQKWGIKRTSVHRWLSTTDHFKPRQQHPRKSNKLCNTVA